MSLPEAPSRQPEELTAPNKRRFGRFVSRRVSCSLGRVLDLSAKGLRLQRRGGRRIKPDQSLPVTLRGLGMELRIRARVIWSERVGLMRHEVGLEFEDIPPETMPKLAQLAQNGATRPTSERNAASPRRSHG